MIPEIIQIIQYNKLCVVNMEKKKAFSHITLHIDKF